MRRVLHARQPTGNVQFIVVTGLLNSQEMTGNVLLGNGRLFLVVSEKDFADLKAIIQCLGGFNVVLEII